ncbi:MAG: acyltransferase [Lachnospiraceae bacterium]|nr:acyltransferase [Lachnospiraceae bacterium]
MTLGEKIVGRNERLSGLKFIAAIMVIFSHSFALNCEINKEWLVWITEGQLTFGSLAVDIFFLASGLLITRSILTSNTNSFSIFLKKRIVRIVPALGCCVMICTFVLGPFCTTYKYADYFTNRNTYKYLLNSVMILQHNLPGVFDNNCYESAVNGALWTLPVEFICYIICYFFCKFKLSDKKVAVWLYGTSMIGWIVFCYLFTNAVIISIVKACMFFASGAIAYVYKDYIKLNWYLGLLSLSILIVSSMTGIFNYVFIIFLAYLIIFIVWGLGFDTKKKTPFSIIGKASYSIYLCGFPIQQTLIHVFGGKMNCYSNFVFSTFFACICGAILYYLCEKNGTKWQNVVWCKKRCKLGNKFRLDDFDE